MHLYTSFSENNAWNMSFSFIDKKFPTLIGDDGNKRIVLDTFNGKDQLYEVQQNKGVNYIVNSKHTLVLYNIKSKNAIGVYVKNIKKIGYLPVENNDELLNFKNSYKISKLQLNQEYPIVEISRYYNNINYISNYEFDYIKKIKYDYKLVEPNKELINSIN